MAENRLTQAGLLALTENTGARARLTQAGLLALTENTGARARLTQAALLVLTDPPPPATAAPMVGRTVSGGQRAVLDGAAMTVSVSVRIADGDGTLQDYASLRGTNWIDSVDIDINVDQPVSQATVRLRRDVIDSSGFAKSLSPFRTDSVCNRNALGNYSPAIDVNRAVQVWVATTGYGVTAVSGDYQWLFSGNIDSYDVAASSITLNCRDLGGALVDRFIEVEAQYGSTPGTPVETVMQSILDARFGYGVITLNVPASPGFLVTPYTQSAVSAMDALSTLAALTGWDVRYRYSQSAAAWLLTFAAPPRTNTTPDQTVEKSRYYTMQRLSLSDLDVRNAFRLTYLDATLGKQTIVLEDTAPGGSIDRYDRRWMGDIEASDSPINTSAEANALLAAMMSDLKDPKADQVLGMAFDWSLDLWQVVRSVANGVHYDADQDYAVVSIKHSLSATSHRTTLETRGAPCGRYLNWLALAKQLAADPTSLAVNITPGDASYLIAWSGRNVTLLIDGAPVDIALYPSPITVTRDESDHTYEFHGTRKGAETTIPVFVPAAFAAGPELEWSIDGAGNLTVFVDGKPGAVRTFVAVRTDRAPTVAEILAGMVLARQTGQLATGVVIAVGTRFWVGAVSETALLVDSKPVWDSDKWLGVGMTPVPTVTFGPAVIQAGQISWPVTFGPATQRVDFFVRYTDSDPSPGSATAPDVENVVSDVFDYFSRGEPAVVNGVLTFSVPLYDGSHWVSATAVPTDALHQRGLKQSVKAQGPGAAVAATPAAPVLSAPTHTSNSIGWTATQGAGGATPTQYRTYLDGAPVSDLAITADPQGLGLFGSIVPSHSYIVSVSALTAAGVEGPRSNVLTITTDADTSTGTGGTGTNGKLPTPALPGVASFSRPSQSVSIPFAFGSGTPSGMECHVFSSDTYAGTYSDTYSTATATPAIAEANQLGTPQTVYFRLFAHDPLGLYTDSDFTDAVAVNIPAGYS